MRAVTAAVAQKDLENLIASVNENCAPIAIATTRGKGAVLIGEDEWAAVEEMLDCSCEPNDESLASIEEAKRIISEGGKGYSSAGEMFEAMEHEDGSHGPRHRA